MRGSQLLAFSKYAAGGIIPAHAGLTPKSCPFKCHGWDHPRACGAHILYESLIVYGLGSSPRMRGSRQANLVTKFSLGIIPAHAGLTNLPADSCKGRWDHPRACGAHNCCIVFCTVLPGSSPRMRGSLLSAASCCSLAGIIPAHAGLTVHPCIRWNTDGDHPRACGAHTVSVMRMSASWGSSPRMRGSRARRRR